MSQEDIQTAEEIAHLLKNNNYVARELVGCFENMQSFCKCIDWPTYTQKECEGSNSGNSDGELMQILKDRGVELTQIMKYYRESNKDSK
jgi:hypothetical protein